MRAVLIVPILYAGLFCMPAGHGHARTIHTYPVPAAAKLEPALRAELPLDPASREQRRTILPTGGATSSFRNAGFEQLDGSGNPTDWNIFREAYVDTNAAVAHSGNNSVRSSYLFGWSQALLPPCSPYETFAIAGHSRSEFKFEMPLIRCGCYNSTGGYITDIADLYTNDAPGEYRLFWTALEPPRGTATMEVYLAGASAQTWMRYDDLTIYTEQIRAIVTEPGDPWEYKNGASELAGEITLPLGASITQRVASSKRDQTYFVAGRYTAAGPTNVTISDVWLPPAYWVTTVTLEQVLSVGAGTGDFVTEMLRPNAFCYGQSKVGFEATTGTIALRDLKRGFARIDPTTFTVGAGSPDPALLMTAAIPRKLTTGTIEIRDSTGTLVATPPVELLGTAVRSEWKPATATAGQYFARFILTCSDAQVVQVDRGFEVVSQSGVSEVPALTRTDFTRGAWLFFYTNLGNTNITQSFALAEQDGFNYAMAHCRYDQLAAVRAAAELHNMPFMVQLQEVRSIFGEYLGADYFSKADYIARVEQLVSPVVGSPMFEGVYVVDEPTGAAALELTQRTSISVAQTPALKFPFVVLTAPTTAAELTALKPAVGMIDPYPFHTGYMDNWSWVTPQLAQLNSQVQAMAGLGRDLWLLPQAFEVNDFDYYRGVPNTEHWAQLGAGVLAGAKGVMPFTYSDGMRDSALQELPKLAPYRRFNTLMDRLGSLLMNLDTPVIDSRVAAPLALTVAQLSPTEKYVLALNAHDRTTHTMLLQFTPAVTTTVIDLVAERVLPLAGGTVQVQLGPGEWAVFASGNRVIDSITTSSVAAPVLSTIPLTVTHQFTVDNGLGLPLVPRRLDFNAAGDQVAVSVPFSYGALPPRVYQLNGNGSVTRQSGPFRFPAGQSFFMGNRLVEATENMGARIYNDNAMGGAPVATFVGQSGGVYDLAQAGSSLWAALSGYGIRRIADGTGNLSSIEAARPVSDYYSDMLTLPGSMDAWTGIRNTGVDRVMPGQLDELLHQRAAVQEGREDIAFNGQSLVAIARGPKGVDLVRVLPFTAPQRLGNVATDTVDAAAVTWVYDDTLAVADSVYHIRFYRVYPDNSSLYIGSWRPDEASSFLFRSLAARDGKLAVGVQDGRVFILNTNIAILKTAASDWQWLQ